MKQLLPIQYGIMYGLVTMVVLYSIVPLLNATLDLYIYLFRVFIESGIDPLFWIAIGMGYLASPEYIVMLVVTLWMLWCTAIVWVQCKLLERSMIIWR